MKTKKELLINDYVIDAKLCNLKCTYCLCDHKCNTHLKESKVQKVKFSSIENKIFNQLNTYEQFIQAEILQLSGGEIFLIQDIVQLLQKKATDYRCIYVFTNGHPLNDKIIAELSHIPNLVLGFSIDGHTLSMNSYRFDRESIFKRIMKNLETVIEHNIPVIINSVLHDRNIKDFKQFSLIPVGIIQNHLSLAHCTSW